MRPFNEPSLRGLRTGVAATSFATGRPLRVMTISSPLAARSSKRERLVFAS